MGGRQDLDNRTIENLNFDILNALAVFVAYDLRLFQTLAHGPTSTTEWCTQAGINVRPAESLISVCTALGLIQDVGPLHSLTAMGKKYLDPDSPTFVGAYIDTLIAVNQYYTFSQLKKAVLENTPQIHMWTDLCAKEDVAAVRLFTESMHAQSAAPAEAWVRRIRLGKCKIMLDIGSGAGTHSIAAVSRYPALHAILFDLPAVSRIAADYARSSALSDRLIVHPGNMWSDPFPGSDVHLYSQIFHDWPEAECRFLAEKSFSSLPPGGTIIIHEIMYDDDKQGPLAAAAYSVSMLLWTRGRQFSARELRDLLTAAGFVGLKMFRTFGNWSILLGTKPR
jgi:O-methyltransferase domain/Dimerisation domain